MTINNARGSQKLGAHIRWWGRRMFKKEEEKTRWVTGLCVGYKCHPCSFLPSILSSSGQILRCPSLSLPHSIKVMMNLQFLLGTERTGSPHNRPIDEGWYVNLGGDGGMPKQDGKCVHLLTLDQH